jgi:(S)-ureidoglycine aminohydrolase
VNPFGSTRSVVTTDHALITPDTHVPAPLAGWWQTPGVIHISPRMGAQFVQYTAHLGSISRSLPMPANRQRFVYVLEGSVALLVGGEDSATVATLTAGGYAYLPAGGGQTLASTGDTARVAVFEKNYVAREEVTAPALVYGQEQKVTGNPFLGDPDALLKVLLPDNPAFDMAVNIFTYQPGATLPNVEIHIMEHGLMMIAGAGVYRLSNAYYPVQNEDIIWMAPYCPQWFVAMGKTPARYLYYKDVNRDPLAGEGV